MNFKRLQSFARIVELRSFSDAAATLQLTQSAISRQMKALEDELGVALLTRNTSVVEPTSIGLRVYERAKTILDDWERIVGECKAAVSSAHGRLRIGASTVPASYLLPRIVKRLREYYPHVELSVLEGASKQIAASVKERLVDIAFVGSVHPSPLLRWERLVGDRLAIVGPLDRQSQTSESGGAPIEELLKQPFVMREEGSGTRRAFEEAVRKLGWSPERLLIAAEVSSTESALALVSAGVGLTAASIWTLPARSDLAVLAEISTDRSFYMAYEQSREQDPLIRLFLHTAQELFYDSEEVL